MDTDFFFELAALAGDPSVQGSDVVFDFRNQAGIAAMLEARLQAGDVFDHVVDVDEMVVQGLQDGVLRVSAILGRG